MDKNKLAQPANSENQNTNNQTSNEGVSWDSLQNLEFNPDKAARLQLEEAKDTFGKGREDYFVSVQEAGGNPQKAGATMLGKNETGYNLDDSSYVSAADVEQTINDALADNDGAQLVDIRQQPPRPIAPAEAVSEISSNIGQEHSSIIISQNENLRNQDARNVEVSRPGAEEKDLKGVLMLGKEQIEFANGEYLSESATIKALENYMIATPEATTPEEQPAETIVYISPEAQNIAKTAISERAKKIKKAIAATAATLIMMASVIGIGSDTQAENSKFDPHMNSEVTVAQTVDSVRAVENLRGVDIGDVYEIPDGVTVHESSDYQYDGANDIGTIGSELLPDQDYTIQSFSILDPDTHEVVVDNVTWEEGTNLGEYLEKVSKRTGVPVEKLEQGTKIHIGHDGSSAGWVDYDDIIQHTVEANPQSKDPDNAQRIIEEAPLQGEVIPTPSDQIGEPTPEPIYTEQEGINNE